MKRIFSLAHIIGGAHVVPAATLPVEYQFVNNDIDCDQFNILYDKNFGIKKTHVVDKVVAQFL